jgi:hypothetical protein
MFQILFAIEFSYRKKQHLRLPAYENFTGINYSKKRTQRF